MKKFVIRTLAVSLLAILGLGFFVGNTYADEEEKPVAGTSIRLSPANIVLSLSSNANITGSFEIKNEGDSDINVEVYAAPYSYAYSEDEDQYKLGFNTENNYTQITRWVKFKTSSGEYAEKIKVKIEAEKAYTVDYSITTPASIPNGGQYTVFFAHALAESTSGSGIKTEASPGIVVYGRSTEGETIVSAELKGLEVGRGITEGNTTRNNIYGLAKAKNNGNVDFNLVGSLKVEPIIGFSSYETPNSGARVSVIPEVELSVFDEWKETPDFGIYKATWTAKAGEETQTSERIFFLFPPFALIILIFLLTFLTIWIIMRVRRRKERRSRLAV